MTALPALHRAWHLTRRAFALSNQPAVEELCHEAMILIETEMLSRENR